MNLTQFIRSHKELDELPFLIVFRTLQILREKGALNLEVNSDGVENVES